MATTKTNQDLVTFAERQDDAYKLRLMRKAPEQFWQLIWLLIIIVIIIAIIIRSITDVGFSRELCAGVSDH